MRRRTPSSGALASDGVADLTPGRLPPRSPLAAWRTPSTCPTSPLVGPVAAPPSAVQPLATPLSVGARSTGSTPARSRRTSCNAFTLDGPPSNLLPNIVSSAFESNITAVQCYPAYGRMHTAPPLISHGDVQTRAGAAAAVGALGGHHHHGHFANLANDINDVDFGLAACLATPMDPGEGLQRRLAPLPATTTAARTAATKLSSADDILQDASRYGDWVRRVRRRRRLERMQGVLAELGSNAVLGRLLDDTMLPEYDPPYNSYKAGGAAGGRNNNGRSSHSGEGVDGSGSVSDAVDQQGQQEHWVASAGGEGAVAAAMAAATQGLGGRVMGSGAAGGAAAEFPAPFAGFRDDMGIAK